MLTPEQLESVKDEAVKAARILMASGFYPNTESAIEEAMKMVRRLKVGTTIESLAHAKVRRLRAADRRAQAKSILASANAAYESACDVLYSGEVSRYLARVG